MMLVSAAENAPRGFANARFLGRSTIAGAAVERPCVLASVAWPIPDSWGEIPYTRLTADVPVSVGGVDRAPITIAPMPSMVVAKVGEKVVVPFTHTRRGEFSGATMNARVIGAGFERVPGFDVTLTGDKTDLTLDLAALKTPPGDYLVAFHGGAVAKYRHHPEKVAEAEADKVKAEATLATLTEEAKKAEEAAQAAAPENKTTATQAATESAAKRKVAEAALAAAIAKVKQATDSAQPRDIVDIVVSEPIIIRVQPMESK